MSDIKTIVSEEVNKLMASIDGQVTDPAQRAAMVRMTTDLADLPRRMALGEDVSLLFDSLKAEAALRGHAFAMKAQAAAQQAWVNIIFRLATAALLP